MKRIKEIEDFNRSNIEQYDVVKAELETAKSNRDEVDYQHEVNFQPFSETKLDLLIPCTHRLRLCPADGKDPAIRARSQRVVAKSSNY